MTTLLVIGLILMVIGIAKTSKEMSEKAAMSMGDVPVNLQPGDTLIDLTADDGRLYLGIRHGDGRQSIKVLDAATGAPVGQLLMETGP